MTFFAHPFLKIRWPLQFNFANFRIESRIMAHTSIENCKSAYRRPNQDDTNSDAPHPFYSRKRTFQVNFETTDELVDLVNNNTELFKYAAYKACQRAAKVPHLRLQNFDVTTSKNHVFFVFSILEKSSFYGNVRIPLDDVSLEG